MLPVTSPSGNCCAPNLLASALRSRRQAVKPERLRHRPSRSRHCRADRKGNGHIELKSQNAAAMTSSIPCRRIGERINRFPGVEDASAADSRVRPPANRQCRSPRRMELYRLENRPVTPVAGDRRDGPDRQAFLGPADEQPGLAYHVSAFVERFGRRETDAYFATLVIRSHVRAGTCEAHNARPASTAEVTVVVRPRGGML